MFVRTFALTAFALLLIPARVVLFCRNIYQNSLSIIPAWLNFEDCLTTHDLSAMHTNCYFTTSRRILLPPTDLDHTY